MTTVNLVCVSSMGNCSSTKLTAAFIVSLQFYDGV